MPRILHPFLHNGDELLVKKRVLLIGPLPIDGDVVGGTKVSFKRLVDEFAASGRFDVKVVNISRPTSGHGRLVCGLLHVVTLLKMMWVLGRSIFGSDLVMLNLSSRGTLFAGPIAWLVARCCRRRLVVRVFGGDFGMHYDSCGGCLSWVASRTFMRADLFLLQTKQLCARFSTSRWFPTTRDLEPLAKSEVQACRRFVFISQLRPEKGWREAVRASSELPVGCSLSVYGPLMPGTDLQVFGDSICAEYRGPISPKDVPKVLSEHDALVFPTFYSGEGIPGIVIEALQSGLPVIATRWGTIPEVIEDEVCGILVEPQEVDELATAMRRFVDNPELYREMSKAALRRGDGYRSSDWQQQLELWCCQLCGLMSDELTQTRRRAA